MPNVWRAWGLELDANTTPSAWIGDLRGTLASNVFAEFSKEDNDRTSVVLRANTSSGAVVLRGDLVASGDVVSVDLAEAVGQGVTPRTASVVFSLFTQERIQGRWEMPDGNAGTVTLIPAPLSSPATQPENLPTTPMQVVQSTKQLPKIAIFRDEIKDLCSAMKVWLPTTHDVIVRAEIDGQEVRRFEPHFWELPNLPNRAARLNLWLSEPGEIARSININLSPGDCSYTVSGADEVWVSGTLNRVEKVLGRKHTWWKRAYEKHALNLNGIALLLAIAFAPSLDLVGRLLLLGSTVVLALAIKQLHDRTTALKIHLRSDYKETPYIELPRLMTALAGAALVGFVTWAYSVLSGGALQNLLLWMSSSNVP